ncbi:hypothetical protein L6452_12777 [Arctium lappa]|uniref:Uncharacterized protein n=1 Tax=Arctium lappa TaxID=4217 RepID=A0ACB9CGB5_ARCLA|nr:hypothetical protein L6452_12777 [Arctium lappa]
MPKANGNSNLHLCFLAKTYFNLILHKVFITMIDDDDYALLLLLLLLIQNQHTFPLLGKIYCFAGRMEKSKRN